MTKYQRCFHCLTCNIVGNCGICEACAINCHSNHFIKFVGFDKFKCCCHKNGSCKMVNVQGLHDARFKCDIKISNDKDALPCYICNTCDNGKAEICETCALKNHIDHEIHFVGNIEFQCQEEGYFDL